MITQKENKFEFTGDHGDVSNATINFTLQERLRFNLRARSTVFLGINEINYLLELLIKDQDALFRRMGLHIKNQEILDANRGK